jgi:hypothetical protein
VQKVLNPPANNDLPEFAQTVGPAFGFGQMQTPMTKIVKDDDFCLGNAV